jgi:hypothetical protein
MKRITYISISILLLCAVCLYGYNRSKYRDLNYTLNKYFTTGIFNKYKMYTIGTKNLYFSDGNTSFFKISGTSCKYPYDKVNYIVSVQKNSSGIWKIKRIYTNSDRE